MLRRTALRSVAVALGAGLAGCSGDGAGGAETPATTSTPAEPATSGPGPAVSLEYFVQNEDDRAHPLTVAIENGDGVVVHERSDPEFEPGEQLTDRSSGYDPEAGPYPITVGLESLSTTIEWTPETCPEFNLLVVVDAQGQLEVEREECIK